MFAAGGPARARAGESIESILITRAVFVVDRIDFRTDGEPPGGVASNPGVTLTRERLSRESHLGGAERTVDVHIARLRSKLEPDPKAPRYLQTVWGQGYVLRAD